MHTRSGTFPFIVSIKASPNPLARQTAVITWPICCSTRSSQVLNLARKYKEKASEGKKGGSVFSLQRYVKSACGGMQRTSHSRSRSRKKNIIVNDIDAAYGVLRDAWKWGKEDGERHIDIVLGDSGFELCVLSSFRRPSHECGSSLKGTVVPSLHDSWRHFLPLQRSVRPAKCLTLTRLTKLSRSVKSAMLNFCSVNGGNSTMRGS